MRQLDLFAAPAEQPPSAPAGACPELPWRAPELVRDDLARRGGLEAWWGSCAHGGWMLTAVDHAGADWELRARALVSCARLVLVPFSAECKDIVARRAAEAVGACDAYLVGSAERTAAHDAWDALWHATYYYGAVPGLVPPRDHPQEPTASALLCAVEAVAHAHGWTGHAVSALAGAVHSRTIDRTVHVELPTADFVRRHRLDSMPVGELAAKLGRRWAETCPEPRHATRDIWGGDPTVAEEAQAMFLAECADIVREFMPWETARAAFAAALARKA